MTYYKIKTTGFILFLTIISSIQGCAADQTDSMGAGGVGDDSASNDSKDINEIPVDYYVQCRDIRCDFTMDEKDIMDSDIIKHGIATWHPHDTGIKLEGDSLEIHATDTWAGSSLVPVNCYKFKILGYWDKNVDLDLKVTVNYLIEPPEDSDDNIDSDSSSDSDGYDDDYQSPVDRHNSLVPGKDKFIYKKKLTKHNWTLKELTFKAPSKESIMTFTIKKEGKGDAVLYFVEIDGNINCNKSDMIQID